MTDENKAYARAQKKLTDDEFDAVVHRSYLLGIAVGYEDFAAKLRVKCGDYFVAGRDLDAKEFRDLAVKADTLGEEKRAEMKKLFPSH